MVIIILILAQEFVTPQQVMGLKATIGESSGTQNFDSVMKSDVIMIIGANPTDGHPVFRLTNEKKIKRRC